VDVRGEGEGGGVSEVCAHKVLPSKTQLTPTENKQDNLEEYRKISLEPTYSANNNILMARIKKARGESGF
jgi:hypothetical protein